MFFSSSIGVILIMFVYTQLHNGHLEKSVCFNLMAAQFFLDLILMSRIGWIYCGILYTLNIVFYWGLFQQFNSEYKETVTISCIIMIFNFAAIAYRHEKTGREYFKALQESNDNLRKFKEIMQGILPSPIIIVNYQGKKVDFMNKSAEKMLRKTKANETFNNINEKHPLKKSEKIESPAMPTGVLFETLNSYIVLKHDLFEFAKETPSFSDLVKYFYDNSLIQRTFLDPTKEFLTIHITDSNETKSESSILEKNETPLTKKHYYEVKVCTITWENKSCLLLIFNDQSKAKRLMELINLDHYKNEMLATISHDLRTPLNGVVGMMWSVLPFVGGKEAKKNLMIGIRSADLLNFLINDILDFSQMSYKKFRLNFENVKVVELVNEIITLFKTQAKKKMIKIKKEFEINENEGVRSDPTRIKQILLNLLGNAIKFTDKGGTITMKIENIYEKLKFSIIDTGIGIKSEDISKLFVLFGKLEQKNIERNKTGIGFGLTISQNLAKLLYSGEDGGIKVESEYGKGSIFSFIIEKNIKNSSVEFNLNENEEEKMPNDFISLPDNDFHSNFHSNDSFERSPNSKIKFQIFNNIKILIVDDCPVNIMILEQYLKFFELQYCSAMNGLEAVKIIEKDVIEENKEISAILMDINMPIMDGFKASETIIDLLKKNKKNEIPIMAITANVTNADIELCFKSGMKKFLAKPVRRRDLGLELEQMFKIKLIWE